jgi:hypothetical protein
MRPLVFLALLVPQVAAAQQNDTPGWDEAPIEERRAEPRVRAGLGAGGGATITNSLRGQVSLVGGGGIGFELGVQLMDRYSLYARVVADTLIGTTVGYGAVLGEVGFDHFSVATGVGLMGLLSFGIFGSGGSASFIAIPIVFGFTPSDRPDTSLTRGGFHLWLDGAFAISLDGRLNLAGSLGLKLGYLWG